DRYRQWRDRHLIDHERGGRRSRSVCRRRCNRRRQGVRCNGREVIAPASRPRRRAFLAVAAGAAVLALIGESGASLAQSGGPLVFAAASLKNALDDLNRQYEADTGRKAKISYAASSTLAKHIESGAPADLFISADQRWMDYAQKHNLIDPKTRHELLGNSL